MKEKELYTIVEQQLGPHIYRHGFAWIQPSQFACKHCDNTWTIGVPVSDRGGELSLSFTFGIKINKVEELVTYCLTGKRKRSTEDQMTLTVNMDWITGIKYFEWRVTTIQDVIDFIGQFASKYLTEVIAYFNRYSQPHVMQKEYMEIMNRFLFKKSRMNERRLITWIILTWLYNRDDFLSIKTRCEKHLQNYLPEARKRYDKVIIRIEENSFELQ